MRLSSLLLGSPETFPLQHRIYNIFTLAIVFNSLFAILVNYVLDLPYTVQLTVSSIALIFSGIYYASRVQRKYRIGAHVSIFAALAVFKPN